MPRLCTNEQHLYHPVEYFWKQTIIGNTPKRRNQPHDDSLVAHIWLQHHRSLLSNKSVLASHTLIAPYSWKQPKTLRYPTTCPFYIFNFLLPRDQIDDILNLDVDVNQPKQIWNVESYVGINRVVFSKGGKDSHYQLLQKACPFSDITCLWSLWFSVASWPNCWFIVR